MPVKDDSDFVRQSLLRLITCMLAGHLPECLSVGLITAVNTSELTLKLSLASLR